MKRKFFPEILTVWAPLQQIYFNLRNLKEPQKLICTD